MGKIKGITDLLLLKVLFSIWFLFLGKTEGYDHDEERERYRNWRRTRAIVNTDTKNQNFHPLEVVSR